MSEMVRLLEENQKKLRQMLQSTAADIWGSSAVPDVTGEKVQTPVRTAAVEKKEKVRVRENTTVDQLWKVADEVIDWTEVLGHDRAPDGLTSDRLWCFYRQHAEAVLRGDVEAYVEVLKACNPLGELTGFATDIQIQAPNAERLEVCFKGCEEQMAEQTERRMYGLSLRIARDLFSTLPVSEVGVEGSLEGMETIRVVYRREKLRKQNFKFLDPVTFAKSQA